EEWRRLLDEVGEAARDAPLRACLGTWDELADGRLAGVLLGPASASDLARRPRLPALRAEVRPVALLPRPIGRLAERGPTDTAGRRARLALTLAPADRALMRFLAVNAVCPALLLPGVLGIGWRDARRRLARLEADGLVCPIGVDEVGSLGGRARLLELT